jgi:hypothetical protein
MRAAFILVCAMLLVGCATQIGTAQWSTGGVRVFEHRDGRIEIIVSGSQHRTYDQIVNMWRRQAEQVARSRGASHYTVISFTTGREVQGWQVVPEGGMVDRYAEDMVGWLPRTARGFITLQ